MKKTIIFLSSLVTLTLGLTATADSVLINSVRLGTCTSQRGGKIELNKSKNGDLAVKLVGLDTRLCNKIRFYDKSSEKTINSHKIKGTSYTLSKDAREALSDDCTVGIALTGPRGQEYYSVSMKQWWCQSSKKSHQSDDRYSFQWSKKDNCKLFIDGEYANKNVSDKYCAATKSRKDMITYEFSKNRNCKVMINGHYANKNVSDHFCKVQF